MLTAVMAALVTVAALAAVIVLRMQRDQAEGVRGAAPPSSSPADAAAACGDRPCEVLTSVPVGSTTVELLADAAGRNGRLRFLADGGTSVQETALAGMGVRLTQRSLSCAKGTTSACLVRGGHDGGVVGEVFVARGGGWEPVEQPYFSSAAFLDLVQVTGNGNAEVAVAQMPDCAGSAAECAGAPIVVEVFGLDGTSEGCTPPYGALTQLPGWPDVDLTDGDLQTCG
ncbi:MAG: hypothetical protein ACRDQB_02170 [Thermocrispum sp.]